MRKEVFAVVAVVVLVGTAMGAMMYDNEGETSDNAWRNDIMEKSSSTEEDVDNSSGINHETHAANYNGIKENSDICLHFSFERPVVEKVSIWDERFDRISMQGLQNDGMPGEPRMPVKPVNVKVPRGCSVEKIDVTVEGKTYMGDGFMVEPCQQLIPLYYNVKIGDETPMATSPNSNIYDSSEEYPDTVLKKMSVQRCRGYNILLLKLYPVSYIPESGQLYFYKHITISISTSAESQEMDVSHYTSNYRGLPRDKRRVQQLVDNLETTSDEPVKTASNAASIYYVIITKNGFAEAFQNLTNWKESRGTYTNYSNLTTKIVLLEDITANSSFWYNGYWGDGGDESIFNDTQCQIRNFIKMAYNNWSTDYVLLGGDADEPIIPHRGVYAEVSEVDEDIPCDMYYGCLDGNWNDNSNDKWGEDGEADLFAEVYIGRAPVDSVSEANNFVHKTIAYENATAHNAEYLKNALMVGSILDSKTEAANVKDSVAGIIPQYTTKKSYHRDGTYNKSFILSEMENGTHIVNYAGHSNNDVFTSPHCIDINDVNSLTNNQYFLVYSYGCYSAAFDNRTSTNGYTAYDAVGEHFITASGGAFAYIGNSRYGWYSPGTITGPGARYDRSFFRTLMNGTTHLGAALQLSKENLGYEHRWTYYTLNLLGDPETQIKTNITPPTAHFNTVKEYRLTPPNYWSKEPVALNGTACKGNSIDTTFSHYIVEYGIGVNPSAWQSDGITLVNDGNNEVINDTLAYWNNSNLSEGFYTLRLTVYDDSGEIGRDWFVVEVWPIAFLNVSIIDFDGVEKSPDEIGRFMGYVFNISNPDEIWDLVSCHYHIELKLGTYGVSLSSWPFDFYSNDKCVGAYLSKKVSITNKIIGKIVNVTFDLRTAKNISVDLSTLSSKPVWDRAAFAGYAYDGTRVYCGVRWTCLWEDIPEYYFDKSDGYLYFNSSNELNDTFTILYEGVPQGVKDYAMAEEMYFGGWSFTNPDPSQVYSGIAKVALYNITYSVPGLIPCMSLTSTWYSCFTSGCWHPDRYFLCYPDDRPFPAYGFAQKFFVNPSFMWELEYFTSYDGKESQNFLPTYCNDEPWGNLTDGETGNFIVGEVPLIPSYMNNTRDDTYEYAQLICPVFKDKHGSIFAPPHPDGCDIHFFKNGEEYRNWGFDPWWQHSDCKTQWIKGTTQACRMSVNATTTMPLYNHLTVDYCFDASQDDITPPRINDIDAPMFFTSDTPYYIGVNCSDDNGIGDVTIKYRYDCHDWNPLSVIESTNRYYTATIYNVPADIDNISLQIMVTDNSGNLIKYQAEPVALRRRETYLTLNNTGTNPIEISGRLTEENGSWLPFVAIKVYRDGVFYKNIQTDENGYYNSSVEGSGRIACVSPQIGVYTTATAIGNLCPVADFYFIPVSPSPVNSITFVDLSHDSDGSVVNWSWDFGDGNMSYEQYPNHQYGKKGTYMVTLTVRDDDDDCNTTIQQLVIGTIHPTAQFTCNPTAPLLSELVTFNDTSFDTDGVIVNWTWHISDGFVSYEQNITHQFSGNGTFEVMLTVRDNDSATDSVIKRVVVGLSLQEGWNLISVPTSYGYSNQSFIDNISGCTDAYEAYQTGDNTTFMVLYQAQANISPPSRGKGADYKIVLLKDMFPLVGYAVPTQRYSPPGGGR
ncbi:MAG: C25 family cysteine peptidase [Thermoplasmatota archaeon]